MPLFRILFNLLATKDARTASSKPVDADRLQISDVRRVFKLRRAVFDKTWAWDLGQGGLLDFSLDTCAILAYILCTYSV